MTAGRKRLQPSGVTISAVCTFCQRPARKQYALARQSTDWERLVAPVCDRCLLLLRAAGNKGRRLKATGDMWWLGHGHGLYDAPQKDY